MSLLNFIKNITTYETRLKIRYKLRSIKALFYRANLDKLAIIHKTDKNGLNVGIQKEIKDHAQAGN